MTGSSHVIGRLRFRHLALLGALDEHRNLHRAAEAIHLAQPGATRLVHELEQVFGFRLFERLPRGMQPTALGEEVLRFARRMLADLDRLTSDLESKRKGGSGRLVIGALLGATPDGVMLAIADLKRRRPHLAVQLLEETSDQLLTLLAQRRIDLAVGPFSSPLQHDLVHYEAMGSEPICILARKDHPLGRAATLTLNDLRHSPWVLQPLSSPARQIFEQELGLAGLATPADLVECASIFATLQLLQASDAVTLLPESVAHHPLQAGLLVRLPLDVGKVVPGVGVRTRRGESASSAAADFIESFRKHGALVGPARAKTVSMAA